MQQLISTFTLAGVAMLAHMLIFFGIAVLRKRNDVADIAWGLGFIIVTIVALSSLPKLSTVHYLLAVLVTLWGLRLATHIYLRNRGKEEDYRYKAWREEWGKWWLPRSFFQVFFLQGLLLLVVVSPVLIASSFAEVAMGWWVWVGLVVWIVGFFFETVGDYQLAVFIGDASNRGKIMKSGLWRYTRHPNYFGEISMWWGVWMIALGTPFGWLGIIGPLTITLLITKVSGIPMLEARYIGNADYEVYKSQTSVLIPLPPKVN